MWNEKQIEQHKKAATEILSIKDEAFELIRGKKGVSEYEVQQFILRRFKDRGMVSDRDPPIVAYDENTAVFPHYYPQPDSKNLQDETFIFIDLWARMKEPKAPFADITWLAYHGHEVPHYILEQFETVIAARDGCVGYLRDELEKGRIPLGKELVSVANHAFEERGFGEYAEEIIGHCIGFYSAHGNRRNIDSGNNEALHKTYGYTIEPGIYIEDKCGMRSEIDFYISNNLELIITTDIQEEIILL